MIYASQQPTNHLIFNISSTSVANTKVSIFIFATYINNIVNVIIILLMNKQYSIHANIKSKYLNSNEIRQIIVSPQLSHIGISHSGNFGSIKRFHIDQLQDIRHQDKRISLNFDTGRVYEIETQKSHLLSQAILHAKNAKLCSKFVEQKINVVPKEVNYHLFTNFQTLFPPKINEEPSLQSQKEASTRNKTDDNSERINNQEPAKIVAYSVDKPEKVRQVKKQYVSEPFLVDPNNWKQVKQKGHFTLMNEQWKGNAGKIFGFVVKKFLTTGSFMGISFPVFAMKPESILQSYAKSIASASKIITRTNNPIERIKQFTVFLWTMSMMNVTLLKPFNPVIGETFQADINGGKYASEQVSHHPSISAFFYEKDNYKIHSSLQLSASIGLNSGQGRFIGDITIEFQDGHWIKGRLPNGEITAILIGQTTFQAFGGAYVFDSNQVVFTYEMGDEYIFRGNIGILNHKNMNKFNDILKDKSRFSKFKAFGKDCYSKIFSVFEGKYGQWINFDGNQYADFHNESIFPYRIQDLQERHLLLKSDSRFRKDTRLLKEGQVQKSQSEKEIIENIERQNRKLRQQYHKH